MDRKTYFNEVYDKFWKNQTYIYGIKDYEIFFVSNIMKRNPKTVFSCGIGNGWPIEIELYNSGVKVSGCDLSEELVEQAKKNLNNSESVFCGSISDIETKNMYDVVFCARASWYIPDFFDCVDEMLNICKSGGMVMFDIMASESIYAIKDTLLNFYLNMIGIKDNYVPRTLFYSVRKIARYIENKGYKYRVVSARRIIQEMNIWVPQKYFFIIEKGE